MLDTRQIFHSIATSWTIPSDLPYFNGHFPGEPIFPAVGIVDASLELVRRHTKTEALRLTGVTNAKFTHPLKPQDPVTIDIAEVGAHEWQLTWKHATQADLQFASVRLTVEVTT